MLRIRVPKEELHLKNQGGPIYGSRRSGLRLHIIQDRRLQLPSGLVVRLLLMVYKHVSIVTLVPRL